MTHGAVRTVTARRSVGQWLGWSAAALLSLALVIAPHAGLAAPFSAKDDDAIGTWVGDANDPTSHYEVAAGAHPGELQLISPAGQKLAPIALRRVAANAFASATGAAPVARLTLTAARHAHLNIYGGDNKKRIMFTYLLLDKQ